MLFQDVQAVFILDAMKSGAEVGTVRMFASNQLEPNQTIISTHGVSVAEAVALGQTLNLLTAMLVFYRIEIHCAVLVRQKTVQPFQYCYVLLQWIWNPLSWFKRYKQIRIGESAPARGALQRSLRLQCIAVLRQCVARA